MNIGCFQRQLVIVALIAVALFSFARAAAIAATFDGEGAGRATEIFNRAEATYADDAGQTYSTASETVRVTVRAVAGLVVTPDETESSANVSAEESITRAFNICNTGNTPDFYTVTRFDFTDPATLTNLYFDTDASGTLTPDDKPVTLERTMSPRVAAGACIAALAVIETHDARSNAALTFRLTARSAVATGGDAISRTNEDTGTIINTVAADATLSAPDDASLPPVKLVDNVARETVLPGETVTYTIRFRNSGTTNARNVVVQDELPAGIAYVSNSLRLDRASLTDAADADAGSVRGQLLEVRLANVAPNRIVEITFAARLNASIAAGTAVVNRARLRGDNAGQVDTSTAVLITDPHGVVYAARSGAPISGARVTLLSDATSNTPITLPQGDGASNANAGNMNPFTTDAQGRWSFALTPANSFDLPVQSGTYALTVAANNFQTRRLALTVEPAATTPGFFNLTVRALDGKQLARAGGFELTSEDVRLDQLARIAFNIPVFEAAVLELAKSVDRAIVQIGDTITYRLEIRNRTNAAIENATIRDVLPPSFSYATGSARLEGSGLPRSIEPETQGGALIFPIGNIAANGFATITYRVRIGTNARTGEARNTAQASGTFRTGERIETPVATAIVRVGAGAFSMSQVVIGRVFDDVDANGSFNSGDKALAGVRVYLANGQSAITDSKGQYNFPLLDDGALVVSLDPVTVPARMRLVETSAANKANGQGWSRLLRTPLGGGTMLRQNFALRQLTEDELQEIGGGNTDIANIAAALVGNSGRKTTNATPNATAEASAPKAASSNAASSKTASSRASASTIARTASVATAPTTATLAAPLAPGTYEFETTETVAPVAPGDLIVLSPRADEVILAPALALDVRVAAGWTTQLEVNNQIIPETNIGVRRKDNAAGVLTLSYVGVSLRPGPNTVRVTTMSEAGARGKSAEMRVFARGAARRLTVTPERTELRADNKDSTLLRVAAFDEWNHPALDEGIAVTVSAGRLIQDGSAASLETNATIADTGGTITLANTEATRERIIQLANGTATVRLVADAKPQTSIIRAGSGKFIAETEVRFATEVRPAILVGLAEASFGRAAPEIALSGEDTSFRSRLRLFYRGPVFSQRNLLTLAYDSQRALNRRGGTNGRDRLFDSDATERLYPVFGDSSTRYADAESNSKLYVRVDRDRSFFQFGDYDTATSDPRANLVASDNQVANASIGAYGDGAQLALYQRRLTGVQVHLESQSGDYVTVSGARPDTAWARDLFPGDSLGVIRLTHADVLVGSEIVTRETRDRRNPEVVTERETLVRGVDYNLDATTGILFFLRPVFAFDSSLNLIQTVVTYEHRADGFSSSVFTARGRKRLRDGRLALGFSIAGERRAGDFGSYVIGGVNAEHTLPRGGRVRFELATSRGTATVGTANIFGTSERADGIATRLEIEQSLGFGRESVFRFGFTRADGRFQNPFGGGGVIGGTQRTAASFETRLRASTQLRFTLSDERNHTENVDNSRTTASVQLTEQVNERLRVTAGYDSRRLHDNATDNTTNSNLITVGAEWQATDKLQLAVKREQNLGDADPTYPNATTISANYAINASNKLFFTQRLASAPITPIADLTGAGFTVSGARRETAVGIESRFRTGTSVNGRYQIENGISGADSFAVIGLGQRLSVTKTLGLDFTFERGFHLAGAGESFTSGGVGFSYQPTENFRTSGRYEIRDRQGLGQVFTLGAAGKLGDTTTALARFQTGRALFGDRRNSTLDAQLALALRPLDTDRFALLLSYNHRSLDVSETGNEALSISNPGGKLAGAIREHSDTLSADGLWQLTGATELYGRFALRRSGDGSSALPFVSTLTFLNQARLSHRFAARFDVAGEGRFLYQPASGSRRTSLGAELGFWATGDLRLGGGYNLTRAGETTGNSALDVLNSRRGFYFTVSSKLSNLFNLFGASPVTTGTSETPAAPADANAPADTAPEDEEDED